MPAFTIVQVSDTHLSRTHAYFQDNWEIFLEEMARLNPDLVLHSGDVSFNGPDAPDDIVFAREQIERLRVPWLAIPGNHDVGEPGNRPRLKQPVTAARLAVWRDVFGTDRHVHDMPGWRFVLLNSEIMGSGLPAEAEQSAFLQRAFATAGDRRIGLMLHKPLFLSAPDAKGEHGGSVLDSARMPVLQLLRDRRPGFVTSGHLHCYHRFVRDGIPYVWAPTTAFVHPQRRAELGVTNRSGYIVWRFEGDRVGHDFVEPGLFINQDVSNWNRAVGSTIHLPPRAHRRASIAAPAD
ncbi:3',5'-cyclic AMP phosphodiesterase CpdA [Constrictibacter sp. MBR-5]|jgi:3',5'-cyclic AMP phosphodiesterase CpdA|uniref:metallophosphoesterase family protein n=1 Tax=Constrictibacter sp. MBR-5 TaxID=3156467 RepID=UPI003395B466